MNNQSPKGHHHHTRRILFIWGGMEDNKPYPYQRRWGGCGQRDSRLENDLDKDTLLAWQKSNKNTKNKKKLIKSPEGIKTSKQKTVKRTTTQSARNSGCNMTCLWTTLVRTKGGICYILQVLSASSEQDVKSLFSLPTVCVHPTWNFEVYYIYVLFMSPDIRCSKIFSPFLNCVQKAIKLQM